MAFLFFIFLLWVFFLLFLSSFSMLHGDELTWSIRLPRVGLECFEERLVNISPRYRRVVNFVFLRIAAWAEIHWTCFLLKLHSVSFLGFLRGRRGYLLKMHMFCLTAWRTSLDNPLLWFGDGTLWTESLFLRTDIFKVLEGKPVSDERYVCK